VSNEILFREAVARGMHLTDSTTRARLVDRLRFMIAGAPATPSEADLLDYYSEHTELYRAEPQISLTQVFFAKPPAAPAEVLAALNRGEQVRADDFWMGSSFPNYGESMLRGMFGTDVLDAARAAPIGTWVGPHLSPRGTHFLRVDARNPAALMRFTDVRDQVAQDMMAARTSAAVAAEVRKLEEAYDVHIQN
jgi:PPIC-type PPIASE domain